VGYHITHHNSSKCTTFSLIFRLVGTHHIKVIFFFPVMFMGFNPSCFSFAIRSLSLSILDHYRIHQKITEGLIESFSSLHLLITPSFTMASDAHYLDKKLWLDFHHLGSNIREHLCLRGTPRLMELRNSKPPFNNPIYLVFHEWVTSSKIWDQAIVFKWRLAILSVSKWWCNRQSKKSSQTK